MSSSKEEEAVDSTPSLLERLAHWAAVQPDKAALTFLDDSGTESDRLTYKEVQGRAQALASGLLSSSAFGVKAGDRVLLVFLPSLDFIVAFLGSVMAGLVPVPVFPPDPRRLKKDLYMFASIQKSSGAQVALTHAAYNYLKKVGDIKSLFQKESAAWPDALTWVIIDKLTTGKAGELSLPAPASSSACFLQYTSGSTSAPKGVVITYRNLTHNLSISTRELQTDTTTVEVSWLPQYHDMGLIGSYLGLLYCGGTGYYMSPFSFIRNPVVWATVMSRVRGTHTQAPNFAFALTAKKYLASEKKAPLDLSCVRHMINAAEPVDGPSLDAFVATFGPRGLPRGVIYPTYGLAEHTVFVCSGGRQRLSVDKDALEEQQKVVVVGQGEGQGGKTREIIGCGTPRHGVDVKIVNPETSEELDEGKVGEIWVDSESKAGGYFNLPDETKEVFHAQIKKAEGDNGDEKEVMPRLYLRTGDLGFLYQQELFVCGRIKDLIIVRGRNHYPQDIERQVEKVKLLRPGCSAAFPISAPLPDGTGEASETIAVIAEVRELADAATYQQIVDAVFQALSTEDGVVVAYIWLLKPRTVPKTTSGKIARKWCQKAFKERSLQTVFEWQAPTGEGQGGEGTATHDGQGHGGQRLEPLQDGQFQNMPLEDIVGRLVALAGPSVMGGGGNEKVVVPLMALGMDSMALNQLKGHTEHYFNITIPDEVFFQENMSLKRLGVILYALGHGRDPREALAQYEANATAFELEAGADYHAVRRDGKFDYIIQTSPCCLCFPCCR